ncbi:MAG: restriction endonuclease subunit S [Bacteroidia bacterium]
MPEKRKNTKKVPNLRFPGFEGEWEERKLGDAALKINSGKTPLGGEAIYLSEGVLFIRSQNINNNRLELENPVFISEEINSGMKNSIVQPNDILLNITGASLGRSCVVPDNFIVGNVNQHVCIIRLSKDNNPRFVQPILASHKGQNLFISLQTGSGREGLNFESIKKMHFFFPSLKEQNRIASFLSIIDERIRTQSKIIEDLESLQKELSKRLFTQKSRFPSFKDKWVRYRVSELLEFFPTNSLPWEQLEYHTNGLYNLHYGMIHQGLSSHLDANTSNLPCIKTEYIPKNYTLCRY